jgi:molybdenum cofactor cytidylyltransferase
MDAIGVIILAAGASVRLGKPKQLVSFRGRSLLRHAAQTALASACRPVIVVLGADAARLERELNGLPVTRVINSNWERGMSSSIGAGLKAAPVAQTEALILMVCDQPMISPQLLDRLALLHKSTGRGIVAAEYAGTRGVPALFSRPYFAQLAALPSREGAKSIIVKHSHDVAAVPFPEGAIDIDTPADMLRMESAE